MPTFTINVKLLSKLDNILQHYLRPKHTLSLLITILHNRTSCLATALINGKCIVIHLIYNFKYITHQQYTLVYCIDSFFLKTITKEELTKCRILLFDFLKYMYFLKLLFCQNRELQPSHLHKRLP